MDNDIGQTVFECFIIGIVSVICCILSHNIIHSKKNNFKSKYFKKCLNDKNFQHNIILCFLLGALVHFLIKQSNLTNMYCRKICYDDKCWLVCDI
jgi:hypothetical protein